MDADGRMIPLVDDDQGEGIKDFIDVLDPIKKIAEIERKNLKESFSSEKGKTQNEILIDILERIEKMEMFLKHTFDGHVLINGRFQKII